MGHYGTRADRGCPGPFANWWLLGSCREFSDLNFCVFFPHVLWIGAAACYESRCFFLKVRYGVLWIESVYESVQLRLCG